MGKVITFESIDSTNAYLSAHLDLPSGTVVCAEEQTAGRGRLSRHFVSMRGKGIYLSMLTHLCGVDPDVLPTVTAWVAVAVCDAIESCTGARPSIKWVNDLILDGRKIGGVLNEVVFGDDGAPSLITGIGLNVSATAADFPPELSAVAGSLEMLLCKRVDKEELKASLIVRLEKLFLDFPRERARYLDAYRRDCITVGRRVRIISADGETDATALAVNDDFSLLVTDAKGEQKTVNFGDVSVRGICGYTE
ncbi:MAG: biotin--[Clostridia bacterium]|nr:biotin--[acetyl-CoA-carboxylase] ligase [Clostridia bacterium]